MPFQKDCDSSLSGVPGPGTKSLVTVKVGSGRVGDSPSVWRKGHPKLSSAGSCGRVSGRRMWVSGSQGLSEHRQTGGPGVVAALGWAEGFPDTGNQGRESKCKLGTDRARDTELRGTGVGGQQSAWR